MRRLDRREGEMRVDRSQMWQTEVEALLVLSPADLLRLITRQRGIASATRLGSKDIRLAKSYC